MWGKKAKGTDLEIVDGVSPQEIAKVAEKFSDCGHPQISKLWAPYMKVEVKYTLTLPRAKPLSFSVSEL